MAGFVDPTIRAIGWVIAIVVAIPIIIYIIKRIMAKRRGGISGSSMFG